MLTKFKRTDCFELNKLVKNTSIFNVYKHMIMKKKASNSTFKNFLLVIYFLYYRISIELGLCMLNNTEKLILTTIGLLIIFSIINQGSRIIFLLTKRISRLAVELIWIYRHYDLIKDLINEVKLNKKHIWSLICCKNKSLM